MTTAFMSCDPEVFGAIWKIRASLARRRSLWVDQGFRFEMRPKSRRNRGLHVGGVRRSFTRPDRGRDHGDDRGLS
jgi:hypothetical protein